jgi:hypothetical protein
VAGGIAGGHGLRFDVNCSILLTELPLLRRTAQGLRPTAA